MTTSLTVAIPQISTGTIVQARAGLLYARLPVAAIHSTCQITRIDGGTVRGLVVGFNEDTVTIAPFESLDGVTPGAKVECRCQGLTLRIPRNVLGSVLDPFGNILQSAQGANNAFYERSIGIATPPPEALSRLPITRQVVTGIRAIDTLCPLGRGQRMGIFAGPGTGKSTLLGTIARNAVADVIVIGLVGERGREVQEFVSNTLAGVARERSVLVVATSDAPAIVRQYAPYSATAIAEHFRDQGLHVLLLIDSLTRTARAIREVNLAAGELPVRQGYTPSVYAELPRLLERPGNFTAGSITALYTLLTSGNGENDALTEEVTSLLDGHLKLSATRALSGIYPALDPVASLSRLASQLLSAELHSAALVVRKIIQLLEQEKETIQYGAAPTPALAAALSIEQALISFCTQSVSEVSTLVESHDRLRRIADQYTSMITAPD